MCCLGQPEANEMDRNRRTHATFADGGDSSFLCNLFEACCAVITSTQATVRRLQRSANCESRKHKARRSRLANLQLPVQSVEVVDDRSRLAPTSECESGAIVEALASAICNPIYQCNDIQGDCGEKVLFVSCYSQTGTSARKGDKRANLPESGMANFLFLAQTNAVCRLRTLSFQVFARLCEFSIVSLANRAKQGKDASLQSSRLTDMSVSLLLCV